LNDRTREPARGWRELLSGDGVDIALRLTLIDLLLAPVGGPVVRPALLGLAIVGLLSRPSLRSPILWASIAGLTGLRVALDWPLPDNHSYLLFYWCLAAALALVSSDPREALAANARWLIAAVFALATLWKLALAPDFVNESFFRVSLILDERFEGLTRLLGGLSPELLAQNRAALLMHTDGPAPSDAAALALPSTYLWLARIATHFTWAFEALVAAAFLWPQRPGLPWRHAALLIFCAVTYAAAPVAPFGWLLLAMGISQTLPEQTRTRLLYVGAYLLILLYRELPWANLLADWLAGP
jgi:hypothetical protein